MYGLDDWMLMWHAGLVEEFCWQGRIRRSAVITVFDVSRLRPGLWVFKPGFCKGCLTRNTPSPGSGQRPLLRPLHRGYAFSVLDSMAQPSWTDMLITEFEDNASPMARKRICHYYIGFVRNS